MPESIQWMLQAMSLTSVTRRDGTTGVEVCDSWAPVQIFFISNSIKCSCLPLGWHLAASSGWFWECAVQPGQAVDGGCRPWCCRQGGGLLTFQTKSWWYHLIDTVTNHQVKLVCPFHQCEPKGVIHQLPDKHGRLRHHRSHKVKEHI